VASLSLQPGMSLVEIGPGAGALTKYLVAIPDIQFHAIEIDHEKVVYLENHYPSLIGHILELDVLQAPVPFSGAFSVIGNFPYNISTQILFKVLEWESSVTEVIGMFQKEVAQRIASGPGSKEYGILSVLMQAFFKVEYLFDVHENCFTPPPKVRSGVIRCTNLHNPFQIENRRQFTLLVKTAFNQRRKTLRNALKSIFPKAIPDDALFQKRAEQLSVTDFVFLQSLLQQQLKNG